MVHPDRQRIADRLWPAELSAACAVWAILDGARDERIYPAVMATRLQKFCLYRGELGPELKQTAPYLVRLERDDSFVGDLLDQGWGNSWGVFLRTEETAQRLRRHFRRFLIVQDEDGKRLIFRYYDPRVLRVYLPTCAPPELQVVFGPVAGFLLESEDASSILEFRFDGFGLAARELPLTGEVRVTPG